MSTPSERILLEMLGDPPVIVAFPGLWANGPAPLAHDYQGLMQSLEEGLATPAHAAFVEELARRSDEVAEAKSR